MLVGVYSCQNDALLEITCHGSFYLRAETEVFKILDHVPYSPNIASCICSGIGGTVGFLFTACFCDTLIASSRP